MGSAGPAEDTIAVEARGGERTPDAPLATLRRVFGYPDFRPGQRPIIEALCAGESAFVVMPTGGGKSLCYQIPALLRAGTAIVVSPLISLMKDQVDALRANGVAAACFNSSLGPEASRQVLQQLHGGALDLLYVAPERLMQEEFLRRLRDLPLALIAIDEAHCVSQWGHDFRPEYIRLGELAGLFPTLPRIAMTATADPQTRDDIRRALGLLEARVHCSGFDRPNIAYAVLEKDRPLAQIEQFLSGRPGASGIVYATSRRRVEQLAAQLRDRGHGAEAYHAGLPDARRHQVQERFLRDEVQIVVATVAFGMGIDKPNVRFVIHADLPKSIESYYQETGRAGRDGLAAETLLLYGAQDLALVRQLIDRTENPERRRIESHKLSTMIGFAESLTCRRQVLLGYFGETLAEPCGNCDICNNPPQTFDATEEARKVLSCVYRVGQRFGLRHVIEVLRGADTQRLRELGHDRLSTYGLGAERSEAHWASILRQLIHRGYLHQDLANYAVLQLTEQARPLLRGELRLELAVPRVRERPAKRARQPKAALELSPPDRDLFERLRALRKRLAGEAGVPPYVVFGDLTLQQMATLRPTDEAALLEISGVGEAKLARYGQCFLEAIADAGGQESLPQQGAGR